MGCLQRGMLLRRGAEGLKALRKHRESFVTRRDFQAIQAAMATPQKRKKSRSYQLSFFQAAGLNAVRVPFGYWQLG